MTGKAPEHARETLVALDFSGTLSLGAVLFGREANLTAELKKASLWAAGLNHPDLFWEVVGSTWKEGSTTEAGYKQLLYESIRRNTGGTTGDKVFRASVSRFVDAYFEHSTIADEWTPLLGELAERMAVVIIVATDHYTEATAHICRQLEGLGLTAAPIREAGSGDSESILVANSADFGSHKSGDAFWRQVADRLEPGRLNRVVLVDDFGHNEAATDRYALADRVAARRERTAAALEETFAAPVAVFPFFLPRNADGVQREGYVSLVQKATRFVLRQAR